MLDKHIYGICFVGIVDEAGCVCTCTVFDMRICTGLPAASRIYTMRWLEAHGLMGEKDVRKVVEGLAMHDPDESVRRMALDMYESYKDRSLDGVAKKEGKK